MQTVNLYITKAIDYYDPTYRSVRPKMPLNKVIQGFLIIALILTGSFHPSNPKKWFPAPLSGHEKKMSFVELESLHAAMTHF